jgi:predicted  nucleic acid-binding Zn-ribbon protein
MDQLARQVQRAKETVAGARAQEASLRDKKDLLGSIRHKRSLKNLKDAEDRLKAATEQWEQEIGPWLRVHEAPLSQGREGLEQEQ